MNQDQLIKYIQAVMQDIFDNVLSAKDLLDDKNKTSLLQAIFQMLDRLNIEISQVIPAGIASQYEKGAKDAASLLKKAGVIISAGAAGTNIAAPFNKKVHIEAVQELVDDTLMDFQAAIRTAKRYAGIAIDDALKAVKTDLTKGMIKGDPSEVARKKVAQSFAKYGLTSFVTRDNKKLSLDFYSMTVTRTKYKQANIKGAINRYQENGVYHVQIDEHFPTCHACAPFQGMVVALDKAHADGFPVVGVDCQFIPFHPNCQHSAIPYVMRFKSQSEIDKERRKWSTWSDKDNRSVAQKKAYEKEQEIRRKANQEKKAYAKLVAVLGDKAPKTIGAYRRLRRADSKSWKKLQSEYLSAVRSM